jgi:hypothetical protein
VGEAGIGLDTNVEKGGVEMSYKCSRLPEGIEHCESCAAQDICDESRDEIVRLSHEKILQKECATEDVFVNLFPKSRQVEEYFNAFTSGAGYKIARWLRLIPDADELCSKVIHAMAETCDSVPGLDIPNAIYLKIDSDKRNKTVTVPMAKELTGRPVFGEPTSPIVEAIKELRGTRGNPSL